MTAAAADISAFFQVVEGQAQGGWSWTYHEEKHYWKATYARSLPPCEIFAEINGACLCLQMEFGELRVRPECRTAFQFLLLRLNDDLAVVKFGLGRTGQVTLMAEVPAVQVTLAVFADLLRAIVAVAGQYRREVELLATDPSLAALVARMSDDGSVRAVSISVGPSVRTKL